MHKFFLLCAAALLIFSACNTKNPQTNASGNESDPKRETTNTACDSTLYGVATDDWGMSTFALKTRDGRDVELVRTHADGSEARIFGDLKPGDEYAVTTADGGSAIGTAINLTQVKAVAGKYFKVSNGRLLLGGENPTDTVEILKLDADSLVARGVMGTYRFGKK